MGEIVIENINKLIINKDGITIYQGKDGIITLSKEQIQKIGVNNYGR